jgi:hypothetical protein
MKNLKNIRLEVIDNSGRSYVKLGVDVEFSFQDDGKTLKLFVKEDKEKSDKMATEMAKGLMKQIKEIENEE